MERLQHAKTVRFRLIQMSKNVLTNRLEGLVVMNQERSSQRRTKKEPAKEELPVAQKAKVAGTTSSSQNIEHLQLTGQAEQIRSNGPGAKL